jgi:PAS domain S-box-containing protein
VDKQLRNIINSFHDQLILLDEHGVIVDYLEAGDQSHFFSKEKISGKNYYTVFPGELSQKLSAAIERIKSGDEKTQFEYKLQIKGKIQWFNAIVSKQENADGTPPGILMIARNITEIKNSELFFSGVLDSSISGIMAFRSVRDNENNIVDFEWIVANKTAETFIGVPVEDIVGKTLLEVMPSNKDDGIFYKYIEVVESGRPMEYEHGYDLQGIYKIWFHTTATKLNDGFALTFQNITKRKNAELALARNEELFRSLFDKAGIGIALLGEGGIAFRVNQKLCDILGYSEKELNRMSYVDYTHVEDVDKDISLYKELLDNKRETYQLEKRYVRKDGKLIWAMLTASVVKDENGQASFVIGMVEDISYRKEAEQALHISETRWVYALEGAGDGVWDWNIQTNEQFYSRQWKAMLGYEEDDIKNTLQEWEDRVHPDELAGCMSLLEQYFKGEIPQYQHEYRIRCKDGSYKWVLSRGKVIEWAEDGEPLRMIGTHTDITERREQQENILLLNRDLEELNNRKNKLISIIGHDLRSPFTSITTLLDIIQQDWQHTFSDELKKYFELLNEKVETTYGLLDSLLTWSRTHMDKVDFKPQQIEVAPLIEKTVSLLSGLAEKKKISIETKVPEGTTVKADGDMLQTVIRNLVSNAIKFTNPEGKVTIAVKAEKSGTLFSVTDTGVGIPPGDMEKILNPNTSYTSYGTSGEKGTGLGLDICRDFIQKHGGQLLVDSTYGEGTTFSFMIPAGKG